MDCAAARKLFGKEMSEISERCWYAVWMLNTEFVLWQAVIDGPMSWGHGSITEDDINTLQTLSKEACGWIMFYPSGPEEELFVPEAEWKNVYEAWTAIENDHK